MSDLLITRLPTLVNVEKMSVAKLREQYKLLEADAISQAQQLSEVCAALHRMNQTAHGLSITFDTLCDSYEALDPVAILLMVKRLSEKRADFNAKQKAKVH